MNTLPSHSHNVNKGHKAKEKKALRLSIIITAIIMVVEIFGGFISNSLALISDAGHMFTHLLALGISFIAIGFATISADDKKTFGYYRIEILAALFNGVFIILVSIYIIYESILRFLNPSPVDSMSMILIAIIGLISNIIVAILLHKSSSHDLNVKGAFIHVMGDTFSSVGVIIAAVLIYFTGISQIDPIASILISILIVYWGFKLIKDSSDILLESAPKGIDVISLKKDITTRFGEIEKIHDMHVWELTSKNYCLSAHIILNDCKISDSNKTLRKLESYLDEKYGIYHTTIQIECKR